MSNAQLSSSIARTRAARPVAARTNHAAEFPSTGRATPATKRAATASCAMASAAALPTGMNRRRAVDDRTTRIGLRGGIGESGLIPSEMPTAIMADEFRGGEQADCGMRNRRSKKGQGTILHQGALPLKRPVPLCVNYLMPTRNGIDPVVNTIRKSYVVPAVRFDVAMLKIHSWPVQRNATSGTSFTTSSSTLVTVPRTALSIWIVPLLDPKTTLLSEIGRPAASQTRNLTGIVLPPLRL